MNDGKNNYTVRWLGSQDVDAFRKLEREDPGMTGFFPSVDVIEAEMRDDNDFYLGIFEGRELRGLCSLGYNDDMDANGDIVSEEGGILSNVYIDSRKRGEGYGRVLIEAAILKAAKENHFAVLSVDLLELELADFYALFGFEQDELNPFSMKLRLNKGGNDR